MNKAQVAPYLMPIVYAVIAVIVVIGLVGITARALFCEFLRGCNE